MLGSRNEVMVRWQQMDVRPVRLWTSPSLRGAFQVLNRPDATQKSRPHDVAVLLGRACRHLSSCDVQGRSASRWQGDTCLQRGTQRSSWKGDEKGDKRLEGMGGEMIKEKRELTQDSS